MTPLIEERAKQYYVILPRIRKVDGLWYCSSPGDRPPVGVGKNPSDPYFNWVWKDAMEVEYRRLDAFSEAAIGAWVPITDRPQRQEQPLFRRFSNLLARCLP